MKNRLKTYLLAAAVLLIMAMLVGTVSAADVVAGGYCGGDETANYVEAEDCWDNLTWTLDSDGVLTIAGTGSMKNYWFADMNTAPWLQNASAVKKLALDDRITTVGDYAFYHCDRIAGKLTLPSSLTEIGAGAFEGCSGLSGSLTIPDSVTVIGESAFSNCTGLTEA